MRKIFFLTLSVFTLMNHPAETNAQTCIGSTIQVTTTVSPTTPSITFTWATITGSSGITINRKTKAATSWGTAIATLAGTATTYTDNTVVVGTAYEYKLTSSGTQAANTYIYAGIQIPQVDSRGKVILLVDNTFTTTLATELTRLENDLTGDGWQVLRHNVDRSATLATVKGLIKTDFTADPTNVKTVFIFGHITVPYSGNIYPDGHTDHQGAWPCDGYYADMTGTWTDATVNNATASRPENDNIPGDGKFDASSLPGTLELEIGRVDLYNMTSFVSTETQLMKQYLDKDHNFRHKNINPRRKALVDDNFNYMGGEAFAGSGYRNFTSFFPPSDIVAGDYFTDMASQSYLWSYGCGPGSMGSCGGVGATTDFAQKTTQSVFTMMFGSYFGDWDGQNNFMRAVLASAGWGLTCSWSGRPHSIYHHMALGDHIGYSARLSMINNSLYVYNYGARYVHIALMGDPTLRMHIVAPPSNVAATGTNPKAISWSASPDAVLGYHVYRQNNGTGAYTKITGSMVTGTNYSDASPVSASDRYMVRAVVLESSNSGTYYNLSQGAFDGGVIDTQAPTIPSNLSAASITQTSFVLNWTASTDNVGVVLYEVYRNGVYLGNSFTNSFTVSGLSPFTTYAMTVKAKDAANNVSTLSTAYNAKTIDNTNPTVPTNVKASNITSTSCTVTWTAATDNVGVAGYDVYKSGTFVGNVTATTIDITGLNPSSTYAIMVKTKDVAGNVSTGSSVVITTLAADPGALADEASTIAIYPNPASDHIVIRSQEMISGSVSIINSSGVVEMEITAQSYELRFDISALPKGAYIIRFVSENQTIVRSLIVQ